MSPVSFERYNSKGAAALTKNSKREIIMGELGIWGLIHLAVVIYAAIQIWNSSADQTKKLVWIAVVAIFPLVGLIVWFFMGPGTPKK